MGTHGKTSGQKDVPSFTGFPSREALEAALPALRPFTRVTKFSVGDGRYFAKIIDSGRLRVEHAYPGALAALGLSFYNVPTTGITKNGKIYLVAPDLSPGSNSSPNALRQYFDRTGRQSDLWRLFIADSTILYCYDRHAGNVYYSRAFDRPYLIDNESSLNYSNGGRSRQLPGNVLYQTLLQHPTHPGQELNPRDIPVPMPIVREIAAKAPGARAAFARAGVTADVLTHFDEHVAHLHTFLARAGDRPISLAQFRDHFVDGAFQEQ